MKNWLVTCAAFAALSVSFVATGASAETIAYTFTGVATGVLDGTGFTDEPFTITLVGDTDNIASGGGEFFNRAATSATFTVGSTSGDLTGTFNEVILNTDPTTPRVVFGQSRGAFFVAEGLQNSAFASYDLSTAFPLTSGDPLFEAEVFETSVGSLEFDSASSASFEAALGTPVPEPSTWAMMTIGFLGLGFIANRASRRGVPIAI
jgi:hypothetical protein